MTKFIFALSTLTLALITPLKVYADCDFDYKVCSRTCSVKHLTDEGAEAGCKTKCAGTKAVCLTKVGVDKTTEVTKKAWDNTKSFVGELTKE